MVICAGSGGVGKTTTAAAVALGLAERGLKVAVVTIDPATPAGQRARPRRAAATSRTRVESRSTGELWAMMLDAKRTFDQLIEHLAPDERPATRCCRTASTSSSRPRSRARRSSRRSRSSTSSTSPGHGTCWCWIRRPPATRSTSSTPRGGLTSFFQGRAIRMFLRPGRVAGPRDGARLRRHAADHRRRPAARPVRVLPRPERDDRRLHRARAAGRRVAGGPGDDLPDRHRPAPRPGGGGDLLPPQAARGGDAVRRARRQPRPPAAVGRAAGDVADLGPKLCRGASTPRTGQLEALAARDASNVERLRSALGDPPTLVVPELEDDVHDLEGLAAIRSTCSTVPASQYGVGSAKPVLLAADQDRSARRVKRSRTSG